MTLLTPYKDLRICLCKAQVPGNQEIASHPSVTSGAVRCMFLKRHKEGWPFPAASRKVLGHCWWVRERAEGSSRSFVSKSLQRAPATAFQLFTATGKAEVRAWLPGGTTHLLHFQGWTDCSLGHHRSPHLPLPRPRYPGPDPKCINSESKHCLQFGKSN